MLNAVITSKDKSGNRISYPIESFDKPLDWESFRGYPLSFQRLYVEKLKEKYNVTQARLSEMFGIHYSTFSRYCSDPLKIVFNPHKMKPAETEAFQNFCAKMEERNKRIAYDKEFAYDDNSMNQVRLVEESIKPKTEIPIVLDGETSHKKIIEEKECKRNRTLVKNMSLNFEGDLYLSDVFHVLRGIMGEGTNGRMHIEVFFD